MLLIHPKLEFKGREDKERPWSDIVMKMGGSKFPGGRLIEERIGVPMLPKRSRSLGRGPGGPNG